MKNNLEWKNITIAQYNELQKILVDKDDETKMSRLFRILYDEDFESMSMLKALSMMDKLKMFLNTKPEMEESIRKSYKVGDIECVPVGFDKMTMSQFMDFQSFAGDGEDHLADVIAVCLVPKGHKYNDGSYDFDQFKEDVGDLPITVGPALISFFQKRLNKYWRHSLSCLAGKIMLSKMNWKKKIALIKMLPAALKVLDTLTIA